MEPYTVRTADPSEQRELTRLCVRATLAAGHDEAFIDRAMPALTVTVPSITSGGVQVVLQDSNEIVGVVSVTPTMMQGIASLHALFVDPSHWNRGIGRMLFQAAVNRATTLKAGMLIIHAEPSAEGFYKRMGAIRFGEAGFIYSPDLILPHLLYLTRPEG